MKAHIGVDPDSGLVHTVVGTAANINDMTHAHDWCMEKKRMRLPTRVARAWASGKVNVDDGECASWAEHPLRYQVCIRALSSVQTAFPASFQRVGANPSSKLPANRCTCDQTEHRQADEHRQ